MAAGISGAGFLAGGLLAGVGQGIEKAAEQEREYAVMMFQGQRTMALENMKIQAAHQDTATRATAEVDASKSRVDAAKVTSTASEADNANTQSHEDARNAAKIAAEKDSASYAGMKTSTDNDGNLIVIDPKTNKGTTVTDANGAPIKADTDAKFSPGQVLNRVGALTLGILNNDPGINSRAKAAGVTPAQQAGTEAAQMVATQQKQFGVGPKGSVPGLVPAPAAAQPSSAAATPVPAPASTDAPTVAPAGAPAPAPVAGASSPTAAAPSFKPGQTIYIKGVPHIVQPDGKTALPASATGGSPPPSVPGQ